MTCREAIKEAAKMYITLVNVTHIISHLLYSIYTVHDEVKDKTFELELSWIGEGKCLDI